MNACVTCRESNVCQCTAFCGKKAGFRRVPSKSRAASDWPGTSQHPEWQTSRRLLACFYGQRAVDIPCLVYHTCTRINKHGVTMALSASKLRNSRLVEANEAWGIYDESPESAHEQTIRLCDRKIRNPWEVVIVFLKRLNKRTRKR